MSQSANFTRQPDGDYISSVELTYNDAFFLRVLLDDFIEHIGEQRLCKDADAALLERAENCKAILSAYLNAATAEIKKGV
ncbi:MAG: hypothetical protein IKO47_02425 [Ruminococcus sp.]|nr:hypothetical protein [Ruminococcus sp.]